MEKQSKLSERQKKFADYFIKSGNAVDSYIKAGYKAKGDAARANASRMLTKANVQEYIKSKNSLMSKSRIADMEEVKAFWSGILRGELDDMKLEVKLRDKIKVSELIAKTNGAFINNLEDTVPKEIRITMSEEIKRWGG